VHHLLVFNNVLSQSNFVVKKGFIKYGKTNGITPMRTCVDIVHPRLLAKMKFVLNERAVTKFFKTYHKQQYGKKKVVATCFVITSFFGSINLYNNVNETQQKFIRDLVLYICKGYMPFLMCENIWLRRLVLRQCPYITFPSCFSFVEHVFLTTITKTMELHVLPHLKSTIIPTKYDVKEVIPLLMTILID